MLKAGTTAAHGALDALIGALDSPAAYRRYLRGVHAFRAPLEERLATIDLAPWMGHWRPSRIAHHMSLDLRDLDLAPLEIPEDGDLSYDVASLFGTLYVLEGSVLGAQLLRRQARALGYRGDRGARHLEVQAGALKSWKEFIEILDNTPRIDLERAACAARETFKSAETCMRRAKE